MNRLATIHRSRTLPPQVLTYPSLEKDFIAQQEREQLGLKDNQEG